MILCSCFAEIELNLIFDYEMDQFILFYILHKDSRS